MTCAIDRHFCRNNFGTCVSCGVELSVDEPRGVMMSVSLPLGLPGRRSVLCWPCALLVADEVKIAEIEQSTGFDVVLTARGGSR